MWVRGIREDKLHTVIFVGRERGMKGPGNLSELAALSQAAAHEASCCLDSLTAGTGSSYTTRLNFENPSITSILGFKNKLNSRVIFLFLVFLM